MFALGKYYEMVYVSPLPTVRRWPLDQLLLTNALAAQKEGGYCATTFMLPEEPGRGTVESIRRLLKVMIEAGPERRDSWETAFLEEFRQFESMRSFYEAFEAAKGQPDYAHRPPVGYCSRVLGSCPCCPAPGV